MQSFPPVWQDEAHAPAVSAARLAPEPAAFSIGREWGGLFRKALHGALFIGGVKILAVWTVAALHSVSMGSDMLWGFIPFTSLDATPHQYQSIAAWSTALACLAAIVWVGFHLGRQRDYSFAQVTGATIALAVAALLVVTEGVRTVAGDRLISTGWFALLLLGLGAVAVFAVWSADGPTKRALRNAEEVGLPITPLQLPPQI